MIIPGELDQLDEQKRPRIARPGDDKMLPLNLRGVSVPAPSGESAGLSFGGPSIARPMAMRSRGVNLQSSSGRTALAQPDEDMLAALGLHPAQMAVAHGLASGVIHPAHVLDAVTPKGTGDLSAGPAASPAPTPIAAPGSTPIAPPI